MRQMTLSLRTSPLVVTLALPLLVLCVPKQSRSFQHCLRSGVTLH